MLRSSICALVIIGVCFATTQTKAQGHYVGGSFNTNDYFIPPSPGWVFTLYYSFSGTNYRNAAGEKVDVIPVSQNPQ